MYLGASIVLCLAFISSITDARPDLIDSVIGAISDVVYDDCQQISDPNVCAIGKQIAQKLQDLFTFLQILLASWPENLKKSRSKKLVNRNKSISRFFLAKFHFLQFQKWTKMNFWTGKKFKTLPEMKFQEKKFDLFDFTSFFAWTFLKILALCCE